MNNRVSFTLVVVCVLSWFLGSAQAAEIDARFDHFTTGFPLSGQHVRTACEACHVKGVFKGTPQQCGGCHNGAIAPGKHARHIVSTNTCDDCHTTFAWTGARMDHSTVTSTCKSCHNNLQAPGMPASHFRTTADCSECHGTLAWSPARVNHAILTGRCDACHNGRSATGKPSNHVPTVGGDCDNCHNTRHWTPTNSHGNITGRCDGCHNGKNATGKHNKHIPTTSDCTACHTTVAWKPANFRHDNITGRCDACHNGTAATGKSKGHPSTTSDCNACHTTATFSGAKFNHANITGRCDACHGSTATAKPQGHMITASDCNVCHMGTTVWTGAVFAHASPNYPGNHNTNVTCASCHIGGATTANWTAPQYKPFCAGCHKSTFDATTQKQSHIKTEGPPIVLYTLDELKGCANTACHIYTDSSFTTIKTLRNSRHTVGGTW